MSTESLDICLDENEFVPKHGMYTKFARLRIVKLSKEGFMNCSCCFPQRWFMPCSHILAVIDNIKYLTPSLIHIRWWKHFNYLFKEKMITSENRSSKKMLDTLKIIRKSHFHKDTGIYKGIPMVGNEWYTNHFLCDFVADDPIDDEYLKTMISIRKMSIIGKHPLQKGSHKYKNFSSQLTYNMSLCRTKNHSNFCLDNDDYDSHDEAMYYNDISDMGAGSQVECSLSQQRTEMVNHDYHNFDYAFDVNENNDENEDVTYHLLEPLFTQAVNSLKSNEEIVEFKEYLEAWQFRMCAKRMSKRSFSSTETTFLGMSDGPRRIEKRHKTWNEKCRNRK
jgi:hypothetical protein